MLKISRFLSRSDGSTAVEFALLCLPFFVLVVGGLQVMIIMLTQQMIETTAEALGRQILTGKVQQQGLTSTQFASLACSLLPATMDCTKLIVDVQVASSFSGAVTNRPDLSAVGNPTSTTVLTYNPGTTGQVVVLRVLYALPVVNMPGLTLQSSSSPYGFNFPIATAVFRNEPYAQS